MHVKPLIWLLLILIPAASATTVTIYPTADATVFRNHTAYPYENWATITAGAGTFTFDGVEYNDLGFIAGNGGNYTNSSRYVASFDFTTTNIPANATITGIVFSERCVKTGAMHPDWGIVNGSLTSNTSAPVAGDYQKIGNTELAPRVLYDDLISGRNYWTFNADGLSYAEQSRTQYLIVFLTSSWDIDRVNGTYVAWDSGRMSINQVEKVGTEYDPYLEVTYTQPGGTPPVAAFSADVTDGSAPLLVGFTDESTNTPTGWDWYWYANETKSSDLQNPNVTLDPGLYNVRLYASNGAGGDWENKTAYIVSRADYYAYGDSITSILGDDTYIMKMRDLYDGSATADHNTDGSGWVAWQGWLNISTHRHGTDGYMMFGVNDRAAGAAGLTTAARLVAMYNYWDSVGVTPHVLINTMIANGTGSSGTFADQVDNITIIQDNLTEQGIPYIKMYDAIDAVPCNGVPDPINPTLLDGAVHPNAAGHLVMAKYLWNSTEYCDTPPGAIANFTENVTVGYNTQTVQFNDTSTGGAASAWAWYASKSFETRNTTPFSTSQNPVHTFEAGEWDVSLYASNTGGGSWKNKTYTPSTATWYIHVWDAATNVSDSTNSTITGMTMFPSDNIENTRIDDLPLTSNSANIIATYTNTTRVWSGGFPTVVLDNTTGITPQYMTYIQYLASSDNISYYMPSVIRRQATASTDQHAAVCIKSTNTCYQFYHLVKAANGTWSAGQANSFNMSSNSARLDGNWNKDLPEVNGYYKYDEVASGAPITHAGLVWVPATNNSWVWPYRYPLQTNNGLQYPPIGSRFRLKASVDMSGWDAEAQRLGTALKTYGAWTSDQHGVSPNGNFIQISTMNDPRWCSPYSPSCYLYHLGQLNGTDWEVVDVSMLMITNDTMAINQTKWGEYYLSTANFSASRSTVRVPGTVTFTDTSSNTPTSWDWSFGDNSVNVTTRNVTHKFVSRGYKRVCLIATNTGGSSELCDYIRVIGF